MRCALPKLAFYISCPSSVYQLEQLHLSGLYRQYFDTSYELSVIVIVQVPKDQWHNYRLPPGEQEYSDEVDCGAKPSEEELSDVSKAITKLWELDVNRLVPGKDYEVDCGEGKKVYQREDMAEGSLFSWLSDDVFRRPTYSRFCSLLDNYNPHEGYKEVVTSDEKQEQEAFIEEISRTAPIKYLHKYLLAKGIASESYEDFKRMISSLWFDLYGRGGTSRCSSAFEHVFVGEIKRGEQEVSGFHNWLQVLKLLTSMMSYVRNVNILLVKDHNYIGEYSAMKYYFF